MDMMYIRNMMASIKSSKRQKVSDARWNLDPRDSLHPIDSNQRQCRLEATTILILILILVQMPVQVQVPISIPTTAAVIRVRIEPE